MINILLVGANGKMGQVISRVCADKTDVKIVSGVDINTKNNNDFSMYSSIYDVKEKCDCIIDFSHPSSLKNTLSYSVENHIPAVIATTGCNSQEKAMIKEAAQKSPIFFSANMSLGVNLIIELAKKATSVLYDNFDIEIVEKHHNQKIDAPSGTALAIADEINSVCPTSNEYIYDRHSFRKKRGKNEIGIHSIRGGSIVGEHEIIFAGLDETIEIKHSAASKEIFAVGAIKAALFLNNKPDGLYSMTDLISEITC